jgi:hypothetical protein
MENLGLALESRHAIGIGGEGLWKDFECDAATQLRILRPIHLTHDASSWCGVNPIVCERSSDQIEIPCIGQLEAPRP